MRRTNSASRVAPNPTGRGKYTAVLSHSLEAETGQATGFKQNGSISVAKTLARLEELQRGASMGKTFGLRGIRERAHLLRGNTNYLKDIKTGIEEFAAVTARFSLPAAIQTEVSARWKVYYDSMKGIVETDGLIQKAVSECQTAPGAFETSCRGHAGRSHGPVRGLAKAGARVSTPLNGTPSLRVNTVSKPSTLLGKANSE